MNDILPNHRKVPLLAPVVPNWNLDFEIEILQQNNALSNSEVVLPQDPYSLEQFLFFE